MSSVPLESEAQVSQEARLELYAHYTQQVEKMKIAIQKAFEVNWERFEINWERTSESLEAKAFINAHAWLGNNGYAELTEIYREVENKYPL